MNDCYVIMYLFYKMVNEWYNQITGSRLEADTMDIDYSKMDIDYSKMDIDYSTMDIDYSTILT